MKRRDFLAKTATATTGVIVIGSLKNAFAGEPQFPATIHDDARPDELAEVSLKLRAELDIFLEWLNEKGWPAYIKKISGIDISGKSADMQNDLICRN